jgi:hypothetical protein
MTRENPGPFARLRSFESAKQEGLTAASHVSAPAAVPAMRTSAP